MPPRGGSDPADAMYEVPYDSAYESYDDVSRPTAPPRHYAPRQPVPGPHRHAAPATNPAPHDYAPPRSPQDLHRQQARSPTTFDTPPPTRTAAPIPAREIYAPVRGSKPEKIIANAPIVPAGSVTGKSLTLVISIMCFLACLTAGAVYMINQSASAWLRDIASEVTVLVEPKEKIDTEKTLREVVQFLGRQPGIRTARAITIEESAGLLEPWLGSSDALKTLPVPRLISLELDRATPPDFEVLRTGLAKQFKGVSLDDHRQWQQQIRTVTRSFALGGIAILLLVAAATTAIIISATRAAMASNREIVEVLHFVGATDRFIAREFERNFMRVGIRAGLVGAGAAMAVFALMPPLMEVMGGGGVGVADMQRLVGTGSLDWLGYLCLAALVIVVAALCRFTSRFSVNRILHSRN